jgi:hypothetical protein
VPELPRAHRALTHQSVSPRTGLPCDQGGTIGATDCRVILGGRATSVPFTAVLIGTERTTTHNAEACSACTVLSSRTSQSCPIWPWEQGVAGLQTVAIGHSRYIDP